MTDKELQKLSRQELLEMLITQTNEVERLKSELRISEEKVQSREIKINEAGSIAKASLELNGVFEAAQAAAEQYLLNIQNTESICRQMREEAEEQAEKIVAEAKAEAEAKEKGAKEAADAYWGEVSERLERFYEEHNGL